jgi:predicted signal transduction protein with EAL and GGDEF domain
VVLALLARTALGLIAGIVAAALGAFVLVRGISYPSRQNLVKVGDLRASVQHDPAAIDISFIRDLTTNPDGAAITVATINMVRSLKRKVIAEGVETESQLEFLRTHACDEIQGYYCSEPLHAADLAELRERHPAGTPWCAPASARCHRVAAG